MGTVLHDLRGPSRPWPGPRLRSSALIANNGYSYGSGCINFKSDLDPESQAASERRVQPIVNRHAKGKPENIRGEKENTIKA